tara:strand:- start:7498 stop:8679 length:1182 start_codon:yes stop_codon:yes gene_type:complete
MNEAEKIVKYRKYLDDNEKQITCYAPFTSMHINMYGVMRPCPFSFRARPHVNEPELWESLPWWTPEHSLKDFFNGEEYENMRDTMIEGKLTDVCSYCKNSIKEDKPPSSLDFDWVGGQRNINNITPKEIEVELSNSCNYMCLGCGPMHSTQYVKDMGVEKDSRYISKFDTNSEYYNKIIIDLKEIIHGLHRINFTGGEPFAQKIVYDILKMIEKEKPKDLKIHFTTNGSIMNGAVKRLAQKENTRFTISLDSINSKIYPVLRVNGNFKNVMNNIDYLLKQKAELGCSFVISKYNVRELPDIVSWCNERFIEFSYHIISQMGSGWDKIIPISVEFETQEYKKELKNYLQNKIDDITFIKIEDATETSEQYHKWLVQRKNLHMFKQYIERISYEI